MCVCVCACVMEAGACCHNIAAVIERRMCDAVNGVCGGCGGEETRRDYSVPSLCSLVSPARFCQVQLMKQSAHAMIAARKEIVAGALNIVKDTLVEFSTMSDPSKVRHTRGVLVTCLFYQRTLIVAPAAAPFVLEF